MLRIIAISLERKSTKTQRLQDHFTRGPQALIARKEFSLTDKNFPVVEFTPYLHCCSH